MPYNMTPIPWIEGEKADALVKVILLSPTSTSCGMAGSIPPPQTHTHIHTT